MKCFAVIFSLLLCVVVLAQERFDYKVRGYFFSGYTGDQAALQTGMKICEQELSTNPRNAQALVWHGTGLYYKAFGAYQQGDFQKGAEFAQRGMKEMDEAVALAPADLGVRIPRGAFLLTSSHYVSDPAMAHPLIEKGVSDLEKAYDIQQNHLSQMGTHPRGELMIGLADGYSRLGLQDKAQRWFERIQTELKGTPYELSANLWFQTKSLPADKAGCLGCHTGN
jgi:tetratricopeptide (TPR) repeat protein